MPEKVCCTYCSIQTDSTPTPIPAIRRWGTERVKHAERFADDSEIPLLLLTADEGLIEKEKPVSGGAQILDGQKLRTKARRMQRQLDARKISELVFLVNPSNELAINYLRLITLACDYANVKLSVLDHRGLEFSQWSSVFQRAEEARRRASKGTISVEEAFQDLFRQYPEDGIVWFKRGEALFDRGRFSDALANFREAHIRLPMREWIDAASQKIKAAERYVSSRPILDDSINAALEEIDRIAINPQLRTFCKDAFRVASDSPSASILLTFAAIEQIDKKITLRGDWAEKVKKLREHRNEVAHRGRIGGSDTALQFREVLLEVMRFADSQRRRL